MSRQDDIRELIRNHQRRLQRLNELAALQGRSTELSILFEIEDIETQIEILQAELRELQTARPTEDSPKNGFKERIQIYWEDNHFYASADSALQSAVMKSFANLIGISPQEIVDYFTYKEAFASDWQIPSQAVQQLQSRLEQNDAQFRVLHIKRVILEKLSGDIEAWLIKEKIFQHLIACDGNKIMNLLDRGLDTGLLVDYVQDAYQTAERIMIKEPQEAIQLCKDAQDIISDMKSGVTLGSLTGTAKDISGLEQPRYSQGKFYLLRASIYLNQGQTLKAIEHYHNSSVEFMASGWLHLKALAYLGSAISQRKANLSNEALEHCVKAEQSIEQEGISAKINTDLLKQAIKDERRRIETSSTPPAVKPSDPAVKPSASVLEVMRVFNIATGARIRTKKSITDLNFLSAGDYESYEKQATKEEEIDPDLTKFADKLDISGVTYILEVPKDIKTTGTLQGGDRILIAEEDNPNHLNGKRVAVLLIQNRDEETTKDSVEGLHLEASLKTFSKHSRNRYFLEAESDHGISYIVSPNKPSNSIINHYKKYKPGGSIETKYMYEVRICSGEVKGIIRQGSIVVKSELNPPAVIYSDPQIWKIPVVSTIAAGLGVITEAILEYVYLDEQEYKGADFGVKVVGDSMAGAAILPDDIALICQQSMVENGEFAAVMIDVPKKKETLEVLKQYYILKKNQDELRHVIFRSNNPSSKDLVVIESGANVMAIQHLYTKRIKENKIEFYKDAEIKIAGKCVGLVRNYDKEEKQIFHFIEGQFKPYVK